MRASATAALSTLLRTCTTSRLFTTSRAAMSAAASEAPKYTYLAVIPDLPDSKRMEVRPQHLANAAESYKKGIHLEGGAVFSDDQAKEDGSAKMAGSWMLFKAENMEKAREWLENDIYTKGGAWDMSKVQIFSVARAPH